MSVDVVLELDAHLSLCRLVLDEWMFQKVLRGWSLLIVLNGGDFNEAVEFLRPVVFKSATTITFISLLLPSRLKFITMELPI